MSHIALVLYVILIRRPVKMLTLELESVKKFSNLHKLLHLEPGLK